MRNTHALLALTALPALLFATPEPTQSDPVQKGTSFPQPSEGLVIPSTDDEFWSLDELLREYGRVTSQRFLIDDDTRNLLKTARIPLLRDFEIAPEQVHSVVESLLFENDFVFAVRRAEDPRLVSVKSLNSSARNNLRQDALFVPAEELGDWVDHPAYLIHTVLNLDALDVRQLTNSMRAMLTDANTQAIIPVGNSHSLIVTGFSQQVAQIAEMMQRVNENERERIANMPKPDAPAGEGESK